MNTLYVLLENMYVCHISTQDVWTENVVLKMFALT